MVRKIEIRKAVLTEEEFENFLERFYIIEFPDGNIVRTSPLTRRARKINRLSKKLNIDPYIGVDYDCKVRVYEINPLIKDRI